MMLVMVMVMMMVVVVLVMVMVGSWWWWPLLFFAQRYPRNQFYLNLIQNYIVEPRTYCIVLLDPEQQKDVFGVSFVLLYSL